MRAPNKPEKNRELNFISLFFCLLVVSVFFSVALSSTAPALAASENPSVALINGEEVYVQAGGSYNFSQDYQIRVKGADPEGKRVWIELCREEISLKDAILTENSQFVYSQNSTEILNLTVKTIYSGATKEDGDDVLVRFFPVYQKLDPGLSKSEIPYIPLNNSSGNNASETPDPQVRAEGFNMPLFFLTLGIVLLFMGLIARKLWKK